MFKTSQKLSKQRGLTLIELMVSLAIIAILLTTVAPGVKSILIQNRIVAEINEVSSLIQFARASAIDEQTPTIVCPSTDFLRCTTDWNNPRMVFVDANNDGERHSTNEPLLVATQATANVNKLTGPANAIVFQANGAANSSTALLLCHQDNDNKYARALSLNAQGQVKMSRDTDRNGIYEYANGTALSCS